MRPRLAVGWIIVAALFPTTARAQSSTLSFGKDVAPILNAKCVMCHRPGEVAPMSLMTYEQVRPWARAVKNKVVSRQMPPWYASDEPGRWRNDRRLSQADIDKLVAWVDAGAPRGSDSELPPPPTFAEGWNHPSGRPPDLIIEAAELKVPADGESPWLSTYVKLPLQGDLWVAAAQVVPGNRAVVHHVMVTSTTLPADVELDAEGRIVNQRPAGVARGTPGGGGAGGPRPDNGAFNAGWEPGVDAPTIYPQGVAERISGTHLTFNLHYQANGRATTDKTRLGLWLQRDPVTHELVGPGLGMGSEVFIANGKELIGRYSAQVTQDVLPPGVRTVPNIPPFADNYRLTQLVPIREEMTLYNFQPHMHLRGQSMKYTAVFPDGREEVLGHVPQYDFNWQIVYELAKPITVPAGTIIRVEASWNNSAKNKYNPKPEQEVFWGEQSWDEMLSPIIRGAVRLKAPVTPKPVLQQSRVQP
jgi:hypothetical protein